MSSSDLRQKVCFVPSVETSQGECMGKVRSWVQFAIATLCMYRLKRHERQGLQLGSVTGRAVAVGIKLLADGVHGRPGHLQGQVTEHHMRKMFHGISWSLQKIIEEVLNVGCMSLMYFYMYANFIAAVYV